MTYNVSLDSEAVHTSWPVRALVSRRELATTKNLIGLLPRRNGELRVDFARVDQERRLRYLRIFLPMLTTCVQRELQRSAGFTPTKRSSGIFSRDGCAVVTTSTSPANARSNPIRPP